MESRYTCSECGGWVDEQTGRCDTCDYERGDL